MANPHSFSGLPKSAQDPLKRSGISLFGDIRIPARNESGGTISKGNLVYFNGYDVTNRRYTIAKADADDPAKQAQAVADHDIPNTSNSFVKLEALIGGLDTSGASAAEDPVYTSATAGAFTHTAPSGADQFKQEVGRVKVKNASTGSIYFNLLVARVEKIGTSFFMAGAVSSAALDETLIRYASTSLTNAQMLNLAATPIEVVAAPGAGKVVEFISAQLFFDYTGAYTETDDNLVFRYTDGSGVQVSEVIEATGFVDATADTATNAIAKSDVIVAKTGCDNKAIVLDNMGNGEFGGGNAANAVRVKVAYRIHSAGW